MPKAGDSFVVTLGRTHLGWGSHRYTSSRKIIYHETYIPIPSFKAKSYKIYNSNYNKGGCDILGVNIFNCTSQDEFFCGVLKASGCSQKYSVYAKNLHGCDNLKALDPWFTSWNAQVGDQVEVKWTSSTDIVITHK